MLAGDRSEWTEDTEISAAKNMARYLAAAVRQFAEQPACVAASNQDVSVLCWRIVVAGVNRNTSAGEAEAEKEADAGADQRR